MDIIEFEMLIKDLNFGDGGYDMGVVYKIIRSLASEILLVKPEGDRSRSWKKWFSVYFVYFAYSLIVFCEADLVFCRKSGILR